MKFNILSLFFITKCLCCDKIIEYGEYLCDDCMKSWQSELIDCAGDVIHLAKYDKLRDTVSKTLIFKMKRRNYRRLYEFLAGEMLKAIEIKLPDYHDYIITNVPRMRDSVKENGLDHAQLFAEMIAVKSGMKYMNPLKHKGRAVQKLAAGYEDRFKNAEKAFVIRNKFNNNLSGYKFLVADDITTSGATLKTCGRILLDNGAADVKYAAICGGN